jgi:hypothetical protein
MQDYGAMMRMLQTGVMQPVADRGPTGPRGINAIAAPESGGVRPYAGGANPMPNGYLPINPSIAKRFQRRLENATDDAALARVVRDAAKYGVDWSHYLAK